MERPDLVVLGQVLLQATPDGITTAEGVAIAGGRILATGRREEVRAMAGPGCRIIEERDRAVVPGLHDAHLHLVGMARRLREVVLDGLTPSELVARVVAAKSAATDGWLRGRGWHEESMSGVAVAQLNAELAEVPALLYSHDTHSAWASPRALERARIGAESPHPAGGRIERDGSGAATGVLRERAADLVESVAGRLRGAALESALDEVLAELAGWGVTGATDAGDTSTDNGVGDYAALGDRASLLLASAGRLDGRLRLAVGFPAAAIAQAAALGLQTGRSLPDTDTLRAGWAKAYADGALGSRTAATFEPYTCGPEDTGILRLGAEELDDLLRAARAARIGLAVHAIGDRAAATVLDAMERGPRRSAQVPPDRIEHLQLLRAADHRRLAAIDVTASIQPVHCAADRGMVEACWSDRVSLAYPWRSLAMAGSRLVCGSDAPIETPDPWLGMFAAVHRRVPDDGLDDWQPAEALDAHAALAGYTVGPAAAAARPDEGHLNPGAHADLAMLNVDLASLLSADERLAGVRSNLTLVSGREVHRS